MRRLLILAPALLALGLLATPRVRAAAPARAAAAPPADAAPSVAPSAPDPAPYRPICITIDDLPIANGKLHRDFKERKKLTEDILAILRRHNIAATGFVVGQSVTGPEDQANLAAWLREGHELGNHTWSHRGLNGCSAADYIADAERCRALLTPLIQANGGRAVRFFRFPFLAEGDTRAKLDSLRAYLARSGQVNAPVTIDNQDWSYEEPWVAARRAGDRAAQRRITAEYQAALQLEIAHHEASGDQLLGRPTPQILLLHANEVGVAQWDSLFTWLEATNHRFVDLDATLADSAFAIPHHFTAPYGCSLWDRLRAERRDTVARNSVAALLKEQSAAWSRGDLDAFCSVYDDSALFISPNGLTRGRQAVLERYRKKYPDKDAMGTLTLDIVEMRPISGREISLLDDALPGRVQGMSVAARWTLTFPRVAGAPDRPPATGHTLLLLRPVRTGWLIVQDASM